MRTHYRRSEVQRHKVTEVRQQQMRCVDCPIRQRALFQVVAEDYLHDAQSRRTAQYELRARHTLYVEDAPALMAYTLFSGWLLLFRTHSDGSRQGLRVALPGDFVGYAPTGDSTYSHGALAITDVVVCGFRQDDLHTMIDAQPDIARQITAIHSRYLSSCESNVLGLGRKSAEQRIAHALADLYHRLEPLAAISENGRVMPFPMTQEMLGELTGLTPVHTNRVLRKLREHGLVVWERQKIEVRDLEGLVELGEYRRSFVR